MSYLLAFLAMFVLDLVWAGYTMAMVERKVAVASVCASAIQLCSALVVIGYTTNRWLLIPVALGAFAGTYVACQLKRRFEDDDDAVN